MPDGRGIPLEACSVNYSSPVTHQSTVARGDAGALPGARPGRMHAMPDSVSIAAH